MRSKHLILLLFAYPIALHRQNAPTQAFQDWARTHVHSIASVADSPGDADLQPLHKIIGDAHVVAFGEPFYDWQEPLAMRNRLIRYGVEQLGFTAVALAGWRRASVALRFTTDQASRRAGANLRSWEVCDLPKGLPRTQSSSQRVHRED